eukprot:23896-Prorocentrum_minimum.AAC.2
MIWVGGYIGTLTRDPSRPIRRPRAKPTAVAAAIGRRARTDDPKTWTAPNRDARASVPDLGRRLTAEAYKGIRRWDIMAQIARIDRMRSRVAGSRGSGVRGPRFSHETSLKSDTARVHDLS